MAINFVSTSSQYLDVAATPTVTLPITLAAWHRPLATAVNGTLITISNDGAVGPFFAIMGRATGAVRATQNDGTLVGNATTAATVTAGTWAHVCGVFTSTTSRDIYLNGANSVNNATSVTGSMAAATHTEVGRTGASAAGYFNGDICEVGLWNVALTTTEIASLANGVPPSKIRPGNLQVYYHLWDVNNLVDFGLGGTTYNLTASNTPTTVAHYGILSDNA